MTRPTPNSGRRTGESMSNDSDSETKPNNIRQKARGAKRQARAKAQEGADAAQHQAADEVDGLSEAIDAAASKLDDEDREGLARYARELSSNLSGVATQLEDRSADELANDAKRLAKRNPAMFMLGSIAVGFGLSRFFKASAEHDNHNANAGPNTDLAHERDAWTGAPLRQRETDATQASARSPAQSNGNDRSTP